MFLANILSLSRTYQLNYDLLENISKEDVITTSWLQI